MTDESSASEPEGISHRTQEPPAPTPGYSAPPNFAAPPPGYPAPSNAGAPGYYAPPQGYPAPAGYSTPPNQYGPPYYPTAGPPFGYPPAIEQHPVGGRRSHRGWWVTAIIAGAVVVLAVIGVIANAVNNNATDSATAGRTFTTPTSFPGHRLDPDLSATAQAKLPAVLDAVPSSFRADLAQTKIAIYDEDADPSRHITYFGVEWSQPKVSYQTSYIDGVFHGSGSSDNRSFDPGPLGGHLRCGTARTGILTCVWADSSMSAIMYDQAASDLDQAAADARALRAAGEH
jgi:hypothetical protein